MSKELHVSDIEQKIQEKMEQYENENMMNDKIRLDELNKLMGWILCGDEY